MFLGNEKENKVTTQAVQLEKKIYSGPKSVNKFNFRDKQGVIWAQPKLV